MRRAKLIGLCGRSGSGKGYVCRKFAKFGIPSIDTDAVYRSLTGPSETISPCMQELKERFGETVIAPDHSLNRRALAAIVFAPDGEKARLDLNRITHRHILEATLRLADRMAEEGAEVILIDAPLLFESGFDTICAQTVCVIASTETSVARIIDRDGITREEALRRLASQIPSEELRSRCDYAILNELVSPDLEEQISAVAEEIRKRNGGSLA